MWPTNSPNLIELFVMHFNRWSINVDDSRQSTNQLMQAIITELDRLQSVSLISGVAGWNASDTLNILIKNCRM